MSAFAMILVTHETQERFADHLDALGNVGADELVNRALDALDDKEEDQS